MNFDDIKDQLLSLWNRLLEKIQDTPTYTQLKDRFDVLSPRGQRMVVLSGIIMVFLFVMILPLTWMWDSSDTVTGFEKRRNVIRELLKVSREASEVPNIPMSPPLDSLKSEIETRAKEANLVDGQIKGIDVVPSSSSLIPLDKAAGTISLSVEKLNIRQLVLIGQRLVLISPSVKMTDLEIVANREDARYFDAVYRMVALAVPDLTPPPAPAEEQPPEKNTRKAKPSKKPKGNEE